MKCLKCGYWNRIEANKLFIEQETSEPKVKAYIPMYEVLKVETCKKCKSVIAEPKELIRMI
jgi:RNase P subunit RPR2